MTIDLAEQLASLTDADYLNLLTQVDKKRTAAQKIRKVTPKISKPEHISTKEFDSFVARTKKLFLGKKEKLQFNFLLQVDVTRHVAWVEDCKPRNVDVNAKVTCKELLNTPWIFTSLSEAFTDYFAENLCENSQSWEQMQQEITALVSDIEAKEKELGLPDQIWDAVYDRCQKFSQF